MWLGLHMCVFLHIIVCCTITYLTTIRLWLYQGKLKQYVWNKIFMEVQKTLQGYNLP